MSQETPNYLVLGAGEVGPAIAHWLLRQLDTRSVVLADADASRAAHAVRRIDPVGVGNRFRPMHLDVNTDDRELREAFRGFDCVISAIPASYSPTLAPLAVSVGAHFVDLGGVIAVSKELRANKKLATNPYRSVIHDCGLAPGLSGQLTRSLHHLLPGARRIVTYVGGLPQKPLPEAFSWQRTFSAKGLVELLGPALTLRSGEVVYTPACSGGVTMSFPDLKAFGTKFGSIVESRVTAGAGLTPEIAAKWGVQDCWEETLRWEWEPFLRFMRVVPPEARAVVIEQRLPHTDREHPDVVVMRVIATADDDAKASYELVVPYDQKLGISAMAKVTGFSAAAVAHTAARGATRPGVMAPEELPVNAEIIRSLSADLNIRLTK